LEANHKLVPGQALIYERANGVTYARYRDAPYNEIPRWIIGGDPDSVARANGDFLDYTSWKEVCNLSLKYPTLKKQLDKLVQTYYLIKNENTH
jgi:hypothetical protein